MTEIPEENEAAEDAVGGEELMHVLQWGPFKGPNPRRKHKLCGYIYIYIYIYRFKNEKF